jgi:hypothetical protein
MPEERIRLAKVVQELREELIEAMVVGAGEPVRFDLEEVKLEAQVVVTREVGGKGSVKFWVLNAEAAAKEDVSRLQKVTLSLKPKDRSGDTVRLGDRR